MSEKTPISRLIRLGAIALRIGLVAFALMAPAGVALATPSLQFSNNNGNQASIYSAEYVLEHWVSADENNTWLEIPGYSKVRLLLPQEAGSQHEVSRFYPHEPTHVAAALAAIEFPAPIDELTIYILPFPRVGLVSSSAMGQSIFLSPGVLRIAEEVTHMVTTHELGHVFHNSHLPDTDQVGWNDYRVLRGIEDVDVYCAEAQHRNRPHEILAEDFRYLFGGKLANYSNTIENADLILPTAVEGLRDFFVALVAERPVSLPVAGLVASNYPNPFNPSTRISLNAGDVELGSPVVVQVYDAQGRLVRNLHRGSLERRIMELEWNGTDDAGRAVPSGVYFSRIRVGAQQLSHKLLLIG